MGIAYGLIYIVATCFFITLVVHSIDRDDVALITSKITMAVCAIGVIGSIIAYRDMPTLSSIDPFDFLAGSSSLDTWSENMTIKSAPYTTFTGVLGIIACGYLLRFVNKTFKWVWIILICILVISTIAACALALGGIEYYGLYLALSVLTMPFSFVQLCTIFYAAGKEKEKVQVFSNTTHTPNLEKQDNQLSKTDQLFKLKELLDGGILTQEEFDSEKKKILNS